MRPVFHFRPWRIQAHVSISVLALLLERVAEIRSGDTWRNLAAQLQKIQVVEYDHGEARVCQTTEVGSELVAILRKLNIAPPSKLHSVLPVPDTPVDPAPAGPSDTAKQIEPQLPKASSARRTAR